MNFHERWEVRTKVTTAGFSVVLNGSEINRPIALFSLKVKKLPV